MKLRNLIVLMMLAIPTHFAIAKSWNHQMDSLAIVTESRFHLPHGLCRAFALQESNWDSTATRIETGYFNVGSRYAHTINFDAEKFLFEHHFSISLTIEKAQRSISFGMFQIMGQNLRCLGYTSEIIALSLSDQFEYFGRFVAPLWSRWKNVAMVAAAFNTGNPHRTGRPYDRHIVQYQRRFTYE